MNEQGRPPRRPRHTPSLWLGRIQARAAVSVELLSCIVRAREALEDGDVALCAAILFDLEEDLAAAETCARPCASSIGDIRCPDCSATFRWPGELAHHRDNVHWQAAA